MEVCPRYGGDLSKEKFELLTLLSGRTVRSPHLLKRLHTVLCYLRAFPDNRRLYALVIQQLNEFNARVRKLNRAARISLEDSGITGTEVHYPFDFASTAWLVKRFPEQVKIDWKSYDTREDLATLLQFLTSLAEQQVFEDQALHLREWMKIAHGEVHASELVWLFRQCSNTGTAGKFVEYMYNKANVPVIWSLKDSSGSITHNAVPVKKISCRASGMRTLKGSAAAEIMRPLPGIIHMKGKPARRLLDVVRAALLVRSREVYHMQYASADAVYLAGCGEGIQIAFIGAVPERRFSLDVSNGYMVFANGAPVAYGGVSPLFFQANTGLNVLDDYRKSESAYIYAQVLRMAHTLFGCTRFIVNPYQFGEDNREALQTGAFWFYHRLGFRPIDEAARKIARKEFEKIQRRNGYRTPGDTLKKLATCDLHLVLPGGRGDPYFPEQWLGAVAAGATRLIAQRNQRRHGRAVRLIVDKLRRTLEIRDSSSWKRRERDALRHLAPVVGLIDDLHDWPATDKRLLVKLIREKGGPTERRYVQLMKQHKRLYEGLRSYCRKHVGR